MFRTLLVRFWNDEAGAVIAAEYLMLGSVVAVGGASGMSAMRDAVNDEYRELGASIREVRQAHRVPMPKGVQTGTASAGAPTAADPLAAQPAAAPTARDMFSAP